MRDQTHQGHLCDLPALLVAYLLLVSLWDQFRARHTAMLTALRVGFIRFSN